MSPEGKQILRAIIRAGKQLIKFLEMIYKGEGHKI